MKHFLIQVIVLLFGFNLLSQNTVTHLTDFADVTFPTETEITETGNDKVFVSEDSSAMYMVNVRNLSNRNIPSFNKDELLEFYQGVADGAVNSVNGKLISTEKIELANSIAFDIEYTANSNPNLPNRRFKRIFLFKKHLFNIQYWPITNDENIINLNKSKFYNSFSVSSENSSINQISEVDAPLINKESEEYNAGFKIGKLVFYLLIIGVPIILILFFITRKRKKSTVQNQNSQRTQNSDVVQVICNNCKAENRSDSKYCKNCGFELKS